MIETKQMLLPIKKTKVIIIIHHESADDMGNKNGRKSREIRERMFSAGRVILGGWKWVIEQWGKCSLPQPYFV
ncbi:hypothetical protein PEC302110_39260 [Pectobacterium araliae]|uniref:Uncharacterized protein n=1 Tax=Pectobacterium araliae TaxID=3073862 RepID=A0AAN0KJ63_9GAMM|nr:hypothetical protein PEC302110_39260 [Pectobacterium sp. MAFF 302110]